jgi:hypothetical protein
VQQKPALELCDQNGNPESNGRDVVSRWLLLRIAYEIYYSAYAASLGAFSIADKFETHKKHPKATRPLITFSHR